MKNAIPFLSISLAFMKPEIGGVFFTISPRYYSSEFSQVIVLFHLSRKSQNKKFLEFFQLFVTFIEIEKCRLFFAFLRVASLIDSCQEKAQNLNQCCCSFNIIAPPQTHLHLNLAPCYIVKQFGSNIDVIRSHVKESRT